MHLYVYFRGWRFLLAFGMTCLIGCRPNELESHLADPFRESLRTAGEKMNGKNRELFNALRYEVGTGGRREADMNVVKRGEQLREAAAALHRQLDALDQMLGSEAPAVDLPDSVRVGMKALAVHLADFAAGLAGLTEKKHRFFPKLPAQDALLPLEEQRRMRSVAAARLALAQLHAEVTMAENEALERLASKIGSLCCFCFTRITPVAAAASATVRVGDPYEAVLFLGTGSRSGWHLWSATLNGVPLRVTGEKLEVRLPPGPVAAEGSSLQITLQLLGKYGQDSTLVIRRPYPVIQRSATHLSPAIQP
jgi:hypothetical protein